MTRNTLVHDWESARNWIAGGRSKITRPIYDRYLSLRLINPDDPDTDISLNYRYRHLVLDPKGKKPRWADSSYAENLNPEPDDNGWLGDYRKPILIYKKDGTVLLTAAHRFSNTRVINDYSGVISIIKKRKVVKIRQPNDTLEPAKRRRRCGACSGDKYLVYTCWDQIGPSGAEYELLGRIKDSWMFVCRNYERDNHTTHIERLDCPRCGGNGYSRATFERWNSYVWEEDKDLLLNQSTQELIL